jgi:metallo-beta-lactamase family protein
MPAELTIAGAAGGVTGSCYRLAFQDAAIVIDCGTFQGGRDSDA